MDARKRRVDPEAGCVGGFLVSIEQVLPDHLREVVGSRGVGLPLPADVELRDLGGLELRGRDVVELAHPAQDVLLAGLRASGIGDRVVARRRLGQPGQHRELGDAEPFERAAEVGLRSGREPVGALTEKDLVDVELKDLVLAQVVLDLECEQGLVELAAEGLLLAEEEVARHLHGDGAGALPRTSVEKVREGGARHADVVDAAVLVEAFILGGKNCLHHRLRHVLDRDEGAPLLAEFADQFAIGAQHLKRDLRAIVGQHLQGGQSRVGHDDGIPDQKAHGSEQRQQQKEWQEPPAKSHWQNSCFASARGNRRDAVPDYRFSAPHDGDATLTFPSLICSCQSYLMCFRRKLA